MKAIGIASALGTTSAYTWLKVPLVAEDGAGDGGDDAAVPGARRRRAGALRGVGARAEAAAVRASSSGRSLLYPDDGDVAAAVDTAAAWPW